MTQRWIKSWVQLALVAALAGSLAACVWRTEHKIETVSKIDAHIVLDIRQIREEAQQVESYVRSDDTPTTDTGKPTSLLVSQPEGRMVAQAAFWPGALSWLDPATSAQAQDEIAPSAEETKAKEARRKRAKAVAEGLKEGYIGENDHGYLTVLIDKNVKDKDQRELLKKATELVKDENDDRRTIYMAIAKKREWDEKKLGTIEVIFAEEIRNSLDKGQKFQAPRDKEFFKAFQKSKLGDKYPDAKPGQWLEKK
jgi:uncharacterized protein YdbL (DUF1318 family)